MRDRHFETATADMLVDATEQLDRDVARLEIDRLIEPSRLPGWSKAHLLTHMARNADGLRNLLLAARTGVELRMYANPRARGADIDAGAVRPADVVVDDVLQSDRRFLAEVAAMPAEAWEVEVVFTSGQPDPPRVHANSVLLMRLNEVAIHHVDLGIGFGFPDIPTGIAETLIARYASRYASQGVRVDGIEGSLAGHLAWLAGRCDGRSLRASDGRDVPALPNLG